MNACVSKGQWIGQFVKLMLLVSGVAAAATAAAMAHQGPTNGDGCHFNETEGYHCH